jgi:hypothetical protein
MGKRACERFALIICGSALILSGCHSNRADVSSEQPAKTNAVLHAAGMIISVEEQAHDEQSVDLLPGPRVCFTIESFAEIPSAERSGYESAERERQAAHGPWCRNTSIDPSATRMKVGDRVDVFFNRDKAEQISVVRVLWRGVDLSSNQ